MHFAYWRTSLWTITNKKWRSFPGDSDYHLSMSGEYAARGGRLMSPYHRAVHISEIPKDVS